MSLKQRFLTLLGFVFEPFCHHFFKPFSVSISGSHFWQHFSIFGAIIDAQGIPLATFGWPFSRQVGSKRVRPRGRASRNRSGHHLSPLGVARATLHVQRRTCNVQRRIFDAFSSFFIDFSSHLGSIFVYFWHVFCIDSSYIAFALQCATSHFQLLFSNLFSILAPTSAPFLCMFGIFFRGFFPISLSHCFWIDIRSHVHYLLRTISRKPDN